MGVAAGLPYLGISVVQFGGVWPLTKAALAHATPLWFALNRAGMAAEVSALLLAVVGRLRWPGRADWRGARAVGRRRRGAGGARARRARGGGPAGRTAIL